AKASPPSCRSSTSPTEVVSFASASALTVFGRESVFSPFGISCRHAVVFSVCLCHVSRVGVGIPTLQKHLRQNKIVHFFGLNQELLRVNFIAHLRVEQNPKFFAKHIVGYCVVFRIDSAKLVDVETKASAVKELSNSVADVANRVRIVME